MKTINIVAIAISVLMLIPLGFGLISSILNTVPTVNTELTDTQIRETTTALIKLCTNRNPNDILLPRVDGKHYRGYR